MRKIAVLSLVLVLALALSVVLGPQWSDASSHREAPAISQDPAADTTDVYVFRSPEAPDTVSIITNWYPIQVAYGGPNFYRFGDDVNYSIHIDNNGDAFEDVTYQFNFRTQFGNPANPFGSRTFLYNTGPLTTPLDQDADYNVRQFMSITRLNYFTVAGRRFANPTILAQNLLLPPNNVGKNSTPNYEALAESTIRTLPGGIKAFAGQRADPFFVDLGAVFDLLQVTNPGRNALAGANVNTIAIQVPIIQVASDANGVIGVWASSSRAAVRIFGQNGETDKAEDVDSLNAFASPFRQVSRLGMPLVNEVVIGLRDKDRFNASVPSNDGQFLSWVTNSHVAELLNLLYNVGAPTTGRNDLVTVFLTGVPGLNQPTNVRASEMIRLNTTTPATPTNMGNRLGVIGGDTGGYPNGRRLIDDVVDISLQVVAGELLGMANDLGDGVNQADLPFKANFPYLASPYSGNP